MDNLIQNALLFLAGAFFGAATLAAGYCYWKYREWKEYQGWNDFLNDKTPENEPTRSNGAPKLHDPALARRHHPAIRRRGKRATMDGTEQ